ncbi:hypothetical protein A4A49_11154 [Nicotiana attenuata]|uniref:Uncharacterized protein n=1 Tax=Nicotiana attenuata TaxID=49451 RepID=A0A314LC43_NICAT|nr:hypothetical protein A4A49_11154 [Nicotiana attenuata]
MKESESYIEPSHKKTTLITGPRWKPRQNHDPDLEARRKPQATTSDELRTRRKIRITPKLAATRISRLLFHFVSSFYVVYSVSFPNFQKSVHLCPCVRVFRRWKDGKVRGKNGNEARTTVDGGDGYGDGVIWVQRWSVQFKKKKPAAMAVLD